MRPALFSVCPPSPPIPLALMSLPLSCTGMQKNERSRIRRELSSGTTISIPVPIARRHRSLSVPLTIPFPRAILTYYNPPSNRRFVLDQPPTRRSSQTSSAKSDSHQWGFSRRESRSRSPPSDPGFGLTGSDPGVRAPQERRRARWMEDPDAEWRDTR